VLAVFANSCGQGSLQGGESGEVEPRYMVQASFVSVAFIATSFLGMSMSTALSNVLLWTYIRSAGSAVLWVYSSVLLQILVKPEVLGRVIAIEFALAVGNEGLSSFVAAFAIDEVKLGVLQVCMCVGVLGWDLFCGLGFYVYKSWWGRMLIS